MSKAVERLTAVQAEAVHWIALLAQVPARHVLRHDTNHPAFHGCIDWHSACHATWALLAARRMTGDPQYDGIVDSILMPAKLEAEAAALAADPAFEMPYGRAWFLRLALEDRLVTGSTRLTFIARDVAQSLLRFLREQPRDPFAREYANPCWALLNLLDYADVEQRAEVGAAARELALAVAPALERLPAPEEEASWPDFMAITPSFCELMVRSGALPVAAVLARAHERLVALEPVRAHARPHHYALNFSRGWALLALAEAARDTQLLDLALDHIELSLAHPSWWRGDYRSVAHWVPQFGIFALQRALRLRWEE